MINLKHIYKKATKILREVSFDMNYILFKHIPGKINKAQGLRILVYHGICETDPHKFNSRFITAKQFEEHLVLIKKIFNPVSLKDLAKDRLSSDKLNVLITFDDGLKNNFTHAFPLLKKHTIPAVFFVTGLANTALPYMFNDITDIAPLLMDNDIEINDEDFFSEKIFLNQRFINKEGVSLAERYHNASYVTRESIVRELIKVIPAEKLDEHKIYFELMNEEDLEEISEYPDYEIGSHGLYHTDLSTLIDSDINNELENSVNYLGAIMDRPVKAIAFPFGNYNQEVIDACENNELTQLFGTEKRFRVNSENKIYERFTINPFVSAINQMYYISKNNYE